MNSVDRTRSAGEYVEWLRQALHEKKLPATARVRAAASCLAIAQEHHHSIILLIEHRLYASAFALLRLAFEAYVRGEWLALCADEQQVERFLDGKEPPKIGNLLEALERTPGFTEQSLSQLKRSHWDAMCAYTHTGGLHVQRWNTAEAIEPAYDPSEVDEVLFLAEVVGSLAVLGVATLGQDESLCELVLDKFKSRAPT
jgi:hypothetical protein